MLTYDFAAAWQKRPERSPKYRVDVDWYRRDYDDRMCATSTPYYDDEGGKVIDEILDALKGESLDEPGKPPRVSLWLYTSEGLKEVWNNDIESESSESAAD